jgi:hypothetical protein
MWHAAAISSPPPTTAPCSTATTGTLPNSMCSKARCQLRECAMPCAHRGAELARSRPEQKWSPSPASTTALTPSGTAAKNASMPNDRGVVDGVALLRARKEENGDVVVAFGPERPRQLHIEAATGFAHRDPQMSPLTRVR